MANAGNAGEVILFAVGDIGPRTEETTKTIFELSAPILRNGDIVFGQLERVLSARGDLRYTPSVVANPGEVVKALVGAGFNVISTAGNHHMDAGMGCFVDTLDILKEYNILPVGVGMNIAEARTPAIIERKGVRVAILGYSAMLSRGETMQDASIDKPGCAPMYVNTYYEMVEYQPGSHPRIVTFADKEDLAAMKEDVKRAKAEADVVIMSIHWGLHHIEAEIADYEYEVGHAAIDAGVDLILGHHAHVLKGFEVYKGKVIFHCLGNFASETGKSFGPSVSKRWGYKYHKLEPGWEKYTDPPESRKTIIAKCLISPKTKRIERVSFRPCMINQQAQAEPLSAEDKRWEEVYRYVEWANKEAGIDTRFSPEGDEVVIQT